MAAKNRGRPKPAPDVIGEMRRLRREGYVPAQIPTVMDSDPKFQGRQPWDPRTVTKYTKGAEPPGPDTVWSLEDAHPEDASAVLDALGDLVITTAGRVQAVSEREAGLIAKIARIRPELAVRDQWRIARQYIDRKATGKPTDSLDLLLALAPWRSDENRSRYLELVDNGQIPAVTDLLGPWMGGTKSMELLRRIMYPATELERRLSKAMLRRPGDEPSAVSNPVSDDARSATGRRRSKRSKASAPQDVTDVDE